jgi:hypothetical protein
MLPELAGLADIVVMKVSQAMAPILTKQAVLESQVLGLQGLVAELRDVKPTPPPVDTSIYERLAVAESKAARLDEAEKRLGELSDRLLTWETKSATEPETDIRDHLVALSPVQERVATCEARLDALAESQKALDAVKDRVAAVEARPATVARLEPDTELRDRVGSIEHMTDVAKSSVVRRQRLEEGPRLARQTVRHGHGPEGSLVPPGTCRGGRGQSLHAWTGRRRWPRWA